MKKYSVVAFLALPQEIESFRRQHIQTYIPPHITVLYPTPIDARQHIRDVISNTKSFSYTLNRLKSSANDYYLYLCPQNPTPFLQLYKEIHQHKLKDESNADMPVYVPHLTIGIFDSQEELSQHKPSFTTTGTITEVALLTFQKDELIDTEVLSLTS